MNPPTAAEVRDWSKVDFGSLGYATDNDLQVLVDRAIQFVAWATGRPLDGTMPAQFDKVAEEATQVLTEMLAIQSQPDIVETAADFMLLSAFSAGPYSETRRSLTELKSSGMISANPILHGLLWMLLTDDMRDQWIGWLQGINAPAFEITEVAWSWGGEDSIGTLPGQSYGEDDLWGTTVIPGL